MQSTLIWATVSHPPAAALTAATSQLPQQLQQLLTPSDLIILAILLAFLVYGCARGLLRTVFSFLNGFASLACAGFAAKAAAPIMANQLVLPIVGDVFEKQAATALQSAAGAAASSKALLGSLSGVLKDLLDSGALASATQPLQEAARQSAQHMAESLSYFLLFSIFAFAFSAIFHMVSRALRRLARIGPISLLNGLAGGAAGLAAGLALVLAILWALTHFAPTIFTELGILSPATLEKTLLTKKLVSLVAPALVGA